MEKETIEAVSHLFTEEFECEICLEHNLIEDKITLSCKHLLCKICYSKIIIKKLKRKIRTHLVVGRKIKWQKVT